jgi:hypothetical protein
MSSNNKLKEIAALLTDKAIDAYENFHTDHFVQYSNFKVRRRDAMIKKVYLVLLKAIKETKHE